MQLLPGSPTSVPQFSSLSFLIKLGNRESVDCDMGEPMLLASPLATISHATAVAAVKELHAFLTATLKAATVTGKISAQDRLAIDVFREDEKLQEELQSYRPLCANGVSLQFRIIKGDNEVLSSLSSLILLSSRQGSTSAAAQTMPTGIAGIVFCVALTGIPSAHSASGLSYSLPRRMNDCSALLTKIRDLQAAKTVLSTFLLSDDENRKTDQMVQSPETVVFTDADDTERARGLLSPMGMMSPMGMISPIANVAKISKRMSMKGDIGGAADNEQARQGVALSLRPSSADQAQSMTERLTILSVAESDTVLRKYATSGQERKANLDLTGGSKSRFRRRKGDGKDPDFDSFDYKGPTKEIVKKKSLQQPADMQRSGVGSPMLNLKKVKGGVPPLSAVRRLSSGVSVSEESFDAFGQSSSRRQPRNRRNDPRNFDDEVSLISEGRSTALESVGSHSRLQVNIALNEDLSCSYKLSQLSSSSVEGVVQVRLRL